jgi:2-amino-4-hydroxy-6-hydroxymethyldihydropteridine diphosphokinase
VGIYLGLGSNVGDRESNFRLAIQVLRDRGVVPWRCASLYWTQPRELEDQPWFLNTVIEVRTLLEPESLLQESLEVEKNAGRVRDVPNGPRPLDVDILIYRDRIVDSPLVSIPHPRFRERRFVLVPFAELAPHLPDPVSGLSMSQLLDLCGDEGEVRLAAKGLL